MSKKRSKALSLSSVQNAILNMLQRGGHLRKDEDNDFRLVNVDNESVPIDDVDCSAVWKLINGSYLKKEKITKEEIFVILEEKPFIEEINIYRITDKGTALLQDHEIETRLKV